MTNSGRNTLPDKWVKAAVVGSVWAAFEIIVGSFLHNLRIPLAGMMLSSFSVLLLIAFSRIWNERWVLIRAGLVCAVMKSLSPSAIILGPMIGIIMEALIIELSLLAGRNMVTYSVAGALAVLWTLIQKVLNLLILYGFDLILIADSFYQYLVKLTGWLNPDPFVLVMAVSIVYAIFGITAAMLGYFLSAHSLVSASPSVFLPFLRQNEFQQHIVVQNYSKASLIRLFVLILGAVAIMYLLNKDFIIVSVIAGSLFVFFIIYFYRTSLRRMRKPGIWIQFLLITLIASLLWDFASGKGMLTMDGLRIGLEMNFRAVIVIFGFSAISTELRNPFIKEVLLRKGFYGLYHSTEMAFSALPALISLLPNPRIVLKHPAGFISALMQASRFLYARFRISTTSTTIVILTGEVHSGKSTYAGRLHQELTQRGWKTGGFIATGTFDDNARNSYNLICLPDQESLPLASIKAVGGWFKFRKYWFNPRAFHKGKECLLTAIRENADLIFLDEIGPMEKEGSGWADVLPSLLINTQCIQCWVIRKGMVDEICCQLDIDPLLVIDVNKHDLNELVYFLEEIRSELSLRS